MQNPIDRCDTEDSHTIFIYRFSLRIRRRSCFDIANCLLIPRKWLRATSSVKISLSMKSNKSRMIYVLGLLVSI